MIYKKLIPSVILLVVAIIIVAPIAFWQGRTYEQRRAAIRVYNDDLFYSLNALQALQQPELRPKLRALFDVSLDAAAIDLAGLCVRYPRLIGRTNYDLLVNVEKYLKQHGHDADRSPALGSPDRVIIKIDEATARLRAVHDVDRWEDE